MGVWSTELCRAGDKRSAPPSPSSVVTAGQWSLHNGMRPLLPTSQSGASPAPHTLCPAPHTRPRGGQSHHPQGGDGRKEERVKEHSLILEHEDRLQAAGPTGSGWRDV